MRMFWALILLAGLLIAAFCISGMPRILQIQKVVKANRKVSVNVLKCSQVHLGKTHVYTLWFQYASQIKNVRIGKEYFDQYCDRGKAELLHLATYPDLFIQPGYRANNELFAQVGIIMMTLACSIYAALQVFPAKLAFKK